MEVNSFWYKTFGCYFTWRLLVKQTLYSDTQWNWQISILQNWVYLVNPSLVGRASFKELESNIVRILDLNQDDTT
jgi:hypothetical protein